MLEVQQRRGGVAHVEAWLPSSVLFLVNNDANGLER